MFKRQAVIVRVSLPEPGSDWLGGMVVEQTTQNRHACFCTVSCTAEWPANG